jgi:hypoxanthine phosphoribosyltransferase
MPSTIILHDTVFQILFSQEEISRKIKIMGEEITKIYGGQIPYFLIVLKGATPFAMELTQAFSGECEWGFTKIKSYNGMENGPPTIDFLELPEKKDKPLIIVEDIVDTGHTVSFLLEILAEKEFKNVKIATLLFKPEKCQKNIAPDWVGFSIPPAFVVGFGLDFDNLGRNLPDIYVHK